MKILSRHLSLLLSVVFVALVVISWFAPEADKRKIPSPISASQPADTAQQRPVPARTAPQKKVQAGQAANDVGPVTTLCDAPPNLGLGTARVAASRASAYIRPMRLTTPLQTFPQGATLTTTDRQGEWFFIRFEDQRWGTRVGFIHCSELAADPRPGNIARGATVPQHTDPPVGEAKGKTPL
jgi:hypothetical protein